MQDKLCCNKFTIVKMNKKPSKTCSLVYLLYSCSLCLSTSHIHKPNQECYFYSLTKPQVSCDGGGFLGLFFFFAFNLRFAVRIFKVGLTPENNQRRVWLHSQPHPEQHSNFTASTKMKTDRARSSFRHKEGKGWALQWNKGFPFQAKTPSADSMHKYTILIWK